MFSVVQSSYKSTKSNEIVDRLYKSRTIQAQAPESEKPTDSSSIRRNFRGILPQQSEFGTDLLRSAAWELRSSRASPTLLCGGVNLRPQFQDPKTQKTLSAFLGVA